MTWEYRVCKRIFGNEDIGFEESFTIIEAYYDDNDEIDGWCDIDGASGISIEELRQDLEYMLMALNKSVLTESELPGITG